ncbi:AI-2E family transporter [Sphingobacterium lumbrici]|uniref:AI-2E family transporter n=1 Tax=Sphingobacterium lumbrici TaxID=2559600 RepID=UPI00112A9A5F|nr:AI-2E family transporter [Sphingobacterium lumbrici]
MKYKQINNNSINQIMLILIIILICILIFKNLLYYLPGFLGATTLYILFRNVYFNLTTRRKWNRSMASLFFIVLSIVFIVLPLWAIIDYLVPKLTSFLGNQQDIIAKFNTLKIYMSDKPILKDIDLSNAALLASLQSLTRYIPSVLNSVAEVGINILVALFVLYFMQVHAKRMETYIYSAIPLSRNSKKEIWAEVKLMVRSNAIGIPILGLCQGLVAMAGYWFFGIENYILWGILTGVSSIIPVLGTMTVYVPICLVTLASGQTANAIGLSIYCFLLVGGIDNILRFTILKQLGNVPPLITVFGVLLGLNMFGMLGLIFGPLILSSVGLLIRVYANEFGRSYVSEKEFTE